LSADAVTTGLDPVVAYLEFEAGRNLPGWRHPEASRFHQRGEGSRAQRPMDLGAISRSAGGRQKLCRDDFAGII